LGIPIFDAITHAFTTLSTGGYSTHSESIAYFKNPSVEFVIMLFAFLGGMNFSIHYYILHRNFRVLRDVEFRIYLSIVLIATAVIAILNLEKYDFNN
jgi:trk system potassium uptake protein TrkH